MDNSEPELALHKDLAREQQIEMLSDRAGKRIFDGNHSCAYRASLDAIEYLCGTHAGHDCAAWNHASCCFVAERSRFPLNCNFHCGKVAGSDTESKSFCRTNASMLLG